MSLDMACRIRKDSHNSDEHDHPPPPPPPIAAAYIFLGIQKDLLPMVVESKLPLYLLLPFFTLHTESDQTDNYSL